MANAVCIFVYEGQRDPVVFSTTFTPDDERAIAHWLDECPELGTLVRRAVRLSGGDDLGGYSEIIERADKAVPA